MSSDVVCDVTAKDCDCFVDSVILGVVGSEFARTMAVTLRGLSCDGSGGTSSESGGSTYCTLETCVVNTSMLG